MRADFRGVPGKIHLVSCHLVVREDPYMRMRDLIADAFGEYPIGRKRFLLGLRYLSRHFKILADIRHIPDPAIMCLWDKNATCPPRVFHPRHSIIPPCPMTSLLCYSAGEE